MSGMLMLAMGLARLGTLVNFISHTVVVGFTAGAGVLILTSQLRDFFGIDLARHAGALQTLADTLLRLPESHPWTVTVGLVTLVAGIAARRLVPKVPYMIVAVSAGWSPRLVLKVTAQRLPLTLYTGWRVTVGPR
jgi:SulP family sulfate permease